VSDVPGLGTTLLPGPVGFHPDPHTWLLNPSYLPPSLLVYFAKAFPTGPWDAILQSLHPLLAQGSGAGYAMGLGLGGYCDPPIHYSGAAVCRYDRQAAHRQRRCHSRLSLAGHRRPRDSRRFENCSPLSPAWQLISSSTAAPPEQVDNLGHILSAKAPPGFYAALIPYLHALGLKQQERLQIRPARRGQGRIAGSLRP